MGELARGWRSGERKEPFHGVGQSGSAYIFQ
jgi:hypothetical protein